MHSISALTPPSSHAEKHGLSREEPYPHAEERHPKQRYWSKVPHSLKFSADTTQNRRGLPARLRLRDKNAKISSEIPPPRKEPAATLQPMPRTMETERKAEDLQ